MLCSFLQLVDCEYVSPGPLTIFPSAEEITLKILATDVGVSQAMEGLQQGGYVAETERISESQLVKRIRRHL